MRCAARWSASWISRTTSTARDEHGGLGAHYLGFAPAAATVAGSELRLTIPPGHGLWCPASTLRWVSGIQSGRVSGAVGSTAGPHPSATTSRCASTSRPYWGWTPEYGASRCGRGIGPQPALRWGRRGWSGSRRIQNSGKTASSRSSALGGAAGAGAASAAVGMGVHPFVTRRSAMSSTRRGWRSTPPSPTSTPPTGGPGGWLPHRRGAREDRPPGARDAMQMMVAVFDFPDRAAPAGGTTSRCWPSITCAARGTPRRCGPVQGRGASR